MRDVVYVAIIIGFFVVCAAYIRACSRIIGHEAVVELDPEAEPVETSR